MSVYIIAAPSEGLVKIGYASRPYARLSNLRSGSPVELVLAAVIPGSPANERQLHRRFAGVRVRGEWFHTCEAIAELVDAYGVAGQMRRRRHSAHRRAAGPFDADRNARWLRAFDVAATAAEQQGRGVMPGEVDRLLTADAA